MPLDELDLMLMKELEINARQGAHVIAKKLGANRTTVDNRLKRLIEKGVVKIRTITNRESLGYKLLYVIRINARPGKSAAVADQLVPIQPIKYVALTTGRFDILTWALFRDSSELMRFLSEDLGNIPDVADIETIISFQPVKNTWRYFTPQPDTTELVTDEATMNDFSELDLVIIKEMELAPRQTMTDLARKVGSNRVAVTRRFQELLGGGIMKFVSVVDPKALEYTVETVLLVTVKPDKIQVVATELAHFSRLKHISLITGDSQIYISASFKDIPELHDFLSNTLSRIPEVLRYENLHVVKELKYSITVLT
ncbi:MAG: Lrp/AsnC family transcriptional regulator [Dehalococcoidia bacterium]